MKVKFQKKKKKHWIIIHVSAIWGIVDMDIRQCLLQAVIHNGTDRPDQSQIEIESLVVIEEGRFCQGSS